LRRIFMRQKINNKSALLPLILSGQALFTANIE